MKNILVFIDNAVDAHQLALSAMNIAIKVGGELTLAHATNKIIGKDSSKEIYTDELNNKKRLEAIAGDIGKKVAKGRYGIPLVHCVDI